ncbi:MAG: C40 family peptidase [Burkholderiales bacterium]|nr:C40 family peptidase [Burkholderiales bacterium]
MKKLFAILFALLLANPVFAADGDGLPAGLNAIPDAVHNLLSFAESQMGAAYRRGGISQESGFDCSGFVSYVFDHVEGISLPHNARAMSMIGSRIRVADLKPGDLVFFRIMRSGISHVGIYLGDNRFIHAASTQTGSVMISDLTESYWARHLAAARRMIAPGE